MKYITYRSAEAVHIIQERWWCRYFGFWSQIRTIIIFWFHKTCCSSLPLPPPVSCPLESWRVTGSDSNLKAQCCSWQINENVDNLCCIFELIISHYTSKYRAKMLTKQLLYYQIGSQYRGQSLFTSIKIQFCSLLSICWRKLKHLSIHLSHLYFMGIKRTRKRPKLFGNLHTHF